MAATVFSNYFRNYVYFNKALTACPSDRNMPPPRQFTEMSKLICVIFLKTVTYIHRKWHQHHELCSKLALLVF